MELSSAFICDGATPSTSDDIASLHPSLPSLALTCEIYSVSESPVVFAGALKSLAEWASDIGDVGCGNDVAVVRVRVGRVCEGASTLSSRPCDRAPPNAMLEVI